MDIDPAKILKLWDSTEKQRYGLAARSTYFAGNNCPTALLMPRIDGREKHRVITNWCQYIIGRHAGFLTSTPVTYSSAAPDSADGLAMIAGQYKEQGLAAADAELMRHALLYGSAVELYTTRPGAPPLVKVCNPSEFTILRNDSGEIELAIRRVELPQYSVFEGELLLDAAVELFVVYTPSTVTRYRRDKSKPVPFDKPALTLLSEQSHQFGSVPLTVYTCKTDGRPHITDCLLRMFDAFDTSRSAMLDDIVHNVDSLLVTKGVDVTGLLEKDEDGQSVLAKIRSAGILPIPPDADASYISRTVDIAKFQYDHKLARAAIHLMGAVPDLDETISGNEGTITSISGVALKLMFHCMLEAASEHAGELERGLRRRIAAFNAVAGAAGYQELTDYSVTVHRNIPFEDFGVLQYMTNLDGLLAREDKLRLLPFITDPAAVAARAAAELGMPPPAPTETAAEPLSAAQA